MKKQIALVAFATLAMVLVSGCASVQNMSRFDAGDTEHVARVRIESKSQSGSSDVSVTIVSVDDKQVKPAQYVALDPGDHMFKLSLSKETIIKNPDPKLVVNINGYQKVYGEPGEKEVISSMSLGTSRVAAGKTYRIKIVDNLRTVPRKVGNLDLPGMYDVAGSWQPVFEEE
jgi:hypothetical protein